MTFPDTPTTQGLSLWCFNTVGGEILTFPDTPTTQGLSLWCFNTVERDFTDFARAPKVWRKAVPELKLAAEMMPAALDVCEW